MAPREDQLKLSSGWPTATHTVLAQGEVVRLVRMDGIDDSAVIKGLWYTYKALNDLGFKPYEVARPIKMTGYHEIQPGQHYIQLPIKGLDGRGIRYTIEEAD